MKQSDFNLSIIGGGAAGLMAAISAAENGCENIVIFEANKRCGVKILMSGGTRCNITNEKVNPSDFFGGSRNFIKNVLNAFDEESTIKFFENIGIRLKLEPTGKYFPLDDDANSVLNALLKRCNELGIKILNSTKIIDVEFRNDEFYLHSENKIFTSKKIILTAGGKSYPSTGSDGSGYIFAKKMGHSIIQPFPALTPILLNEPELTRLSGITIPAKLLLFLNAKKYVEIENSLLLTHVGISGPAALNISREVERLKKDNISLQLNFIPKFNFDDLVSLMMKEVKHQSDKSVLKFFKTFLPSNLCETLFRIASVDFGTKFYSIKKEELKHLAEIFTNYKLNFTGVKGFKQAEVTAGGVPLTEVRYQSMESKIQKGLFLAGEILDVDGLIGGYNFQWAWSSGFVAGKNAVLVKALPLE